MAIQYFQLLLSTATDTTGPPVQTVPANHAVLVLTGMALIGLDVHVAAAAGGVSGLTLSIN
jgi:hypothetical protein